MGENPQHNQHIIEQANMMDAAFSENNQNIFLVLNAIIDRLDHMEERISTMEQNSLPKTKNGPTHPFDVEFVPTKSSLKKLRDAIFNYFR